jgi:membrane protein implicated in regulation of membrane protease activity
MDGWIWWSLLAAVPVVAEVVTGTLVLIMLAVGALAAAAAAAGIGAGAGPQVAAFAVVSGIMLLLVRPVAARHLRQPRETRTGVAALVGADAVILDEVTPDDGRIRLAGEIWSARAYDGATTFAVGERVQVLEIKGATALVG